MKLPMEMRTAIRNIACSLTVAASLGAAAPAHALMFNLTSTGNAQVDAGFQAAANFWQGIYIDPVTINITAGFSALGAGILGQANSTYYATNFSAMKTALGADANSANDAIMVGGLPSGNSYSKLINGTANFGGTTHVQSGITAMEMTRANAKAIGLVAGNAAGQDAAITFSSNFAFDFDQTNGIGAGLYDFVGIAIHELGHAMGFTSGVDVLDFNSNGPNVTGPFTDAAFNPFATLLDFTRCSAASQTAGADMDWRIGTAAKSFAIDGNCTALVANAWSTGVDFGDGRQASHWKDGLGLGIMDPTAVPTGNLNVVTPLDILAFDVIGWNLAPSTAVPEPDGLLLLCTALFGLAWMQYRRQRLGLARSVH